MPTMGERVVAAHEGRGHIAEVIRRITATGRHNGLNMQSAESKQSLYSLQRAPKRVKDEQSLIEKVPDHLE